MTDTETTTAHNHRPNFGRKVEGCPRCTELDAGAPARSGWGRTEPVTGYDYTYRTANYARAIR